MATLKDIAEATGLSMNTVSRALRGRGYVSKESLAEVRRVAEELGYRPNLAARKLRGGRSEIAVVLGSADQIHVEKAVGIREYAAEHGFTVAVHFARTVSWAAQWPDFLEEVVASDPAGVIFVCFEPEAPRAMLQRLGNLPAAFVCYDREPEVDCVFIDRFRGVRDAVRLLVQSGRRRIAYIGSPQYCNRRKGYLAALEEAGLEELFFPLPYLPVAEIRAEAEALALQIGAMPERPDAIQCSDYIASGLLAGFARLGIRVPEEIAVIGFDDRDFAELLSPPLTTVAQPNIEVGRRAAELLLNRLAKPEQEPQSVRVPMSIVRRISA